jgi:hypothetical protein
LGLFIRWRDQVVAISRLRQNPNSLKRSLYGFSLPAGVVFFGPEWRAICRGGVSTLKEMSDSADK